MGSKGPRQFLQDLPLHRLEASLQLRPCRFPLFPLRRQPGNENPVEGRLPHQPEVAIRRHPAGDVGPAVHHPLPQPVGTNPVFLLDPSANPFPFFPEHPVHPFQLPAEEADPPVEGGNEGKGGGQGRIRVEPAEKGETSSGSTPERRG